MIQDATQTTLAAAAREVDRLSLVIESAVRNADPVNHPAVLAALARLREVLA